MKKINFILVIVAASLAGMLNIICFSLYAQTPGCNLQPPVIKIDFGSDQNEWKVTPLKNYQLTGSCPDDGYISLVSYSGDCFSGHWHKLYNDHSGMGAGGKMLIVNAAYDAGVFFTVNIGGLKPGAKYQLASWIANICKENYECVNIPPLLEFTIESRGIVLKKLISGNIYPGNSLEWKQYAGFFEMPANETAITLKITDKNPGGCGNDFVMDDITISECIYQLPTVSKESKSRYIKNIGLKKPVTQPGGATIKPLSTPILNKQETPKMQAEMVVPNWPQKIIKELPMKIASRANPVIRQILTPPAEMLVELYDNGQIDGDTISVYHNNNLVISQAGLSAKPLVFKIKVDQQHPHHELVMVAENLGSIPPNTSLMIATVLDKRYEIFISSSQEKNAKIIIDLEK